MICLGIESTAHTFSVGLVSENGRILSCKSSVFRPPRGSGIRPSESAKFHAENASGVLKKALNSAKITLKDVDIISFSQGPGLPNCLQIGASIARFLSIKHRKLLVGVNHCVSHIEIGRLTTGCKDPIVVYCSGGNTQIIGFAGGKYRIFGETEDMPIGNAFDVLARSLGMEMPGGPKIDSLAKKGRWIELPYVVKGMDLSFSGILTECEKKIKMNKAEDVCYSFIETCFSMLTEVSERALAHTDKREVLLVGGVAASPRLREVMTSMCRGREAKCYAVPKEYAGDNGAMIAWTGILTHKSGQKTSLCGSEIRKDWRTDEVDVIWLKQK